MEIYRFVAFGKCVVVATLCTAAPLARAASPQRHPPLTFTSLGEITDEWKKTSPPSVQAPFYYTVATAKYRPVGDSPQETPIEGKAVEELLRRSLATNGFLPADDTHAPSVGLVYFWGPHALTDTTGGGSQEQILRNVLDRAALAGGDPFAADLAQAFRDSSRIREATAPSIGGSVIGGGAAASMAQISGMADPVLIFRKRDPQNEALLDQATASCYYLVVSAYDYKSLATPQKKLLWRTRATVNSQGVSQSQVFPTLISVAGPFLGREALKPKIVRMRANEALVETHAAENLNPSATKN